MQTMMRSEQESEQTQPTMMGGSHVGNLFFGLFLGLLLLIFDRRHNLDQLPPQPHKARSGGWRSFLIFCGVLLVILLLIVLWVGP